MASVRLRGGAGGAADPRAAGGLRTLRIVRLPRLFKLVKLTRLARLAHVVNVRSQELVLIKFSVLMVFLIHWVSCSWCLLAQFQRDYELTEDGMSWEDNEDLTQLHRDCEGGTRRCNLSVYLHGIEFAVSSMALSYSRGLPESTIEQGFALIIQLMMGCA